MIRFASGVIFDSRSVVLSVAGLFGGPVVTDIATVFAGAYRLYLGGVGARVGGGIIVSFAMLAFGRCLTVLADISHHKEMEKSLGKA